MLRRASVPAAAVLAVAAFALSLSTTPAAAAAEDAAKPPPTIAEKTRGMTKLDGFVPLYWDARAGKLWLEVGRFGEEMIYVVALSTGVGSNDIGLDRSQLGSERIVSFERVGPRVLLVQPNYDYRAGSDNPDERRAVAESFARSVLWGFEVGAETDGRVLVDATDFAVRDAHGVVRALKSAKQGAFSLDSKRSAVYLPRTKGFPRNSEIEVELTFTGDEPGPWVRDVTPTPEAITVRQRHSFVALPEPGYTPREGDPGAGFFGIAYADYATPIGEPLTRRFIARHRLQKKDPSAAVSEPVAPIVYYLDRGAPEPIRSALLEGASWWAEAFEAAGFRNAFRVELLPEGADPMDVRYNVIQWVHRATRGWSYGASVSDPRTGEILKGHVLLGSLRVRQDYLLAEGLLAPYASGEKPSPEAEAFALARLRQLSAHEVGHTLGLAHNYIASTYGRASVMDYPHPWVTLDRDGNVDVSNAYATGIGEWDKVAIGYGYREFAQGTDEQAALRKHLADARARGIVFITDQDARPQGGAHPRAHLWDNAPDAAAELARVMEVRRAALNRFGENVIPSGAPLATMEETLVPLYLHHRYQVEAAVKMVGGVDYNYARRGDGQPGPRRVPAADQLRALDAVLATLSPEALALPDAVREAIPPRPYTYGRHRELFPRYTGLVFDDVAPAVTAAQITVALLLHPERAARLVEQPAADPALSDLGAVIDRLVDAVFAQPSRGRANAPVGMARHRAEVARAVQRVVADGLMQLAEEAPMPQVRAVATSKLEALGERLEKARGDDAQMAHASLLVADIDRFVHRDDEPEKRMRPLEPPPGSPIGLLDGCGMP